MPTVHQNIYQISVCHLYLQYVLLCLTRELKADWEVQESFQSSLAVAVVWIKGAGTDETYKQKTKDKVPVRQNNSDSIMP